MVRVVIIGNAGGGKSTLARAIAEQWGLRHIDIDELLWQEDWKLTPVEIYEQQHAEIIAGDAWVIDGLGRQDSIAARLDRATKIILVDMPLWMHFWLASERQMAWLQGTLEHTPGDHETMPPTRELFRTIWEVDQTWMPDLRIMVSEAEKQGKATIRLTSVEELEAFRRAI